MIDDHTCSYSHLHVFVGKPEHPHIHRGKLWPVSRFKPRIFFLWGHSANHYTTHINHIRKKTRFSYSIFFFFEFTIKISSSRMNKWHGLLHVGSISPSGLQMCLLCWVEPSTVCVHFCVFPWKRSYKLYLIWNSSTPMNTHNENKLLFLGLMAVFQIHFHVTLTAADVSSI